MGNKLAELKDSYSVLMKVGLLEPLRVQKVVARMAFLMVVEMEL
jgi:hypothetical protein